MTHFKGRDIVCFHSWRECYRKGFPKIGKIMTICAFYYDDDSGQLLKMESNLDGPTESLKSGTLLIDYGDGCSEAVHYEHVIRIATTQEIFAWEMAN